MRMRFMSDSSLGVVHVEYGLTPWRRHDFRPRSSYILGTSEDIQTPMNENVFSPETYAASRKPLAQASPLPGACYVSPEWYERELETIFRTEWLCVGRVDQVPNSGDFYTIPLLGQPLIVARDRNDKVNVLSRSEEH